ncbi:hypothetical protein LTR35_000566 [Friedmanniomyces endolithicus]|uniref:Uncharacterized protein n=1 Tax=Friedmanniomyces endolithicus TaxID=329885 RepID=A0AAN6F8M7_9PEZI|nr:hypothetical protein LTS00_013994 [Friedmanniomyces endolithicus]KAK0292537.1 hypothetical protein LTR35_000566 [Friedmanniomyces endolithicus]KAK0309709.1 hypothetical protein LTR82_015062 [Friedmanniomyces endolithicus]KAK1007723.1 hypothetical protein LTR54_006451 [Friedmanniomyces endolithicus]KAK1065396.1 hypothetical protein LTR74_007921 [Friedmanniomyces endolithicus]
MCPYDLGRPAKALGSSTHARTWCDAVPFPEREEDSDADSEASYASSMTRSLEMPPYQTSSPPNPQRVNSMTLLQLHYPEGANRAMDMTSTMVTTRPRIPLEPVRSTQRGHYPIITRRFTPYTEAWRPMQFKAIERCTSASERHIDEGIVAQAWYDNFVDDDGDDDDEWVVIEHEDGEFPWEMVDVEEEDV